MSRVATKSTEVFTFAELSAKAQAKAIETFSEREGEYWSGEYASAEFKKKLEALGFEDVDTQYSGFYSQGDGASFTSSSFDIRKVMKAIGIASLFKSFYSIVKTQDIQGRVYRIPCNYAHECTIKVDFPEYMGYSKQEGDVARALTEYVRGLSKSFYNSLETEYDYACSEENARQYLEEEGTEYTASGKEYHC